MFLSNLTLYTIPLAIFPSVRKTNIVEHVFKMMQKHSSGLEEMVRLRMVELEDEKRRKEALINRMLPP